MGIIRAVAVNVIKSVVPLGWSSTAVVGHLKHMGLGYHNTTMLADVRKAFGRVKYESQIRALKPGSKVPDAWMDTDKLGAPFNYRVHLKVEYYDEETGTYDTGDRFMFQNENKPVDEFEGVYPDYATAVATPESFKYVGSTVVGVTKNERPGEVPF